MLEIAGGIIIAILAIGAVIFAAVRWQEVINGILGFCALVALAYLAVEGFGMLSGHAQRVLSTVIECALGITGLVCFFGGCTCIIFETVKGVRQWAQRRPSDAVCEDEDE
jgi:hypothetical protein